MNVLTVIGRRSSHFTRTVLMFAEELDLSYELAPVRDLTSRDASDYGGNPALKLPVLHADDGAWFGALTICRKLNRESTVRKRIVWPEDLTRPLLGNAQELTLEAMAAEVTLIMDEAAGIPGHDERRVKSKARLLNSTAWLDTMLPEVLVALPVDRDLSFLEVTLFCFASHLPFRRILPLDAYPNLKAFCSRFGERPSATSTAYRFDNP